MNKKKYLFKIWFKNGTYIEKEKVFDEEPDKLEEGFAEIKELVINAFRKNSDGYLSFDYMVIRISELIAIDIVPITEH